MAKSNPLGQGLMKKAEASKAPPTEVVSASASSAGRPPSRQGMVMIGGHFVPDVQRALKIIAAQEGTTVQALLAEGIDTVLAARGLPEIAGIKAEWKA